MGCNAAKPQAQNLKRQIQNKFQMPNPKPKTSVVTNGTWILGFACDLMFENWDFNRARVTR
jgi:hypothetical protein